MSWVSIMLCSQSMHPRDIDQLESGYKGEVGVLLDGMIGPCFRHIDSSGQNLALKNALHIRRWKYVSCTSLL